MKNVWRICLGMCISVVCAVNSNAQNYVLNFDGTNDYVNLGSDAGDGLRTVEIWFKPDINYNSTLANPAAIITRNDATQNGEFGIYIGSSAWAGREGKLVFHRGDNGTVSYVVSDANSWTANVWHHVAGVIDPVNGMRLYVDGVLQMDTDPTTMPTATKNEYTAIGKWGNANIRHFDGSVNDGRFWTRALSQTEVQTKMCALLDPANETGLKTYWRMDEGFGITTSDFTGNGYNGNLQGPVWVTDTVCAQSQGNFVLDFDGINDYVDVGKDAGDGIRSIEFWFNPDISYNSTLSAPATFVDRNDGSQNSEFGVYIGSSAWAGREGRLVFYRGDNGTVSFVVSDANSWNANQWYHVAGVIDPINGMRLYIDGILQADTDPSTAATAARNEITAFGRWGDASIRHFDGSLDEMRFWDRAISQTEVQAKMCKLLDPTAETGLKGYWRFNEGVGSTAFDLSGNSYDGEVKGAKWLQDSYCRTDQKRSSINTPNRTIDESGIQVYPNPFSDHLTIEFVTQENKNYAVLLYNSTGQLVNQFTQLKEGKVVFGTANQSSGIYYYQVLENGQSIHSGKAIMN